MKQQLNIYWSRATAKILIIRAEGIAETKGFKRLPPSYIFSKMSPAAPAVARWIRNQFTHPCMACSLTIMTSLATRAVSSPGDMLPDAAKLVDSRTRETMLHTS